RLPVPVRGRADLPGPVRAGPGDRPEDLLGQEKAAAVAAGAAGRRGRDAAVTTMLAGMFEPGRDGRRVPESLYGAVKAWGHLRRRGVTVARCTVERIMRAHSWRGTTRQARKVPTTVPDPA